ncbi:hypothetical protein BCR33DRAFT_784273 [Rhizoclosmatium globosum]|uniref:Uncharacterized protein n=1 Tax=Rhizoclosmatium globosum TaxID=329046 RepID=A0A1Y2CF11_9FUNG|nr:hypothetical protein BCR33DRAFT_784273 [Rhizoclosmatium globosum]|eukprot:ORY45487.1 hypothetical protein BCR33DRAFT_784273 [Rhizoclosmatium globosum]
MSALVSNLHAKMDGMTSADLLLAQPINLPSSIGPGTTQQMASPGSLLSDTLPEIQLRPPSPVPPPTRPMKMAVKRKKVPENRDVMLLKSPAPPGSAISPTTAARSIFSFDGTLPNRNHVVTVSGTPPITNFNIPPPDCESLQPHSLQMAIANIASLAETNSTTSAKKPAPPSINTNLTLSTAPQSPTIADPAVDYVLGTFMDTINNIHDKPSSSNIPVLDRSLSTPATASDFTSMLTSSVSNMEGAIGSFDAFHSLLEKQQQQFQQEEPQFQFVNMFGQIVTPSSSYQQQQQFSRPYTPPIQHTQISRLSATKPQVPSPLTSVTHPESPYSGESSPPTPHNIRLNSTPSEPSTTIHRPHSKLSISTSSTNSPTPPTTLHNPASQTSPKPPPFWPAPRKSTSNQLTASALSTSHTTQNQQQPPLHPHHDCKKSFKLQDSLTSHMIAAHNMSVPGVVSTSGSLGVGLPGLVQAGGAPLVASVAEVHGHGAEQGGKWVEYLAFHRNWR